MVGVFPTNIEEKLEFDEIRSLVRKYCLNASAEKLVDEMAPIKDLRELQPKLDQLREFMKLLQGDDQKPDSTYGELRPLLARIKIQGTFLDPDHFVILGKANRVLYEWKRFLTDRGDQYPNLFVLTSGWESDVSLSNQIESTIDESGIVKDSASPELARIRHEMLNAERKVRKSIRSVLDHVKKENFTDTDSEVTIRDGRLVIPVRAEHKRKIAGFVHDESASGQTVYMEPAQVLELNNLVRELSYQEKREVTRILTELADRVRHHMVDLDKGAEFLTELDFIQAKAKWGQSIEAIIPKVSKTSGINLEIAYHPLLKILNEAQGKPVVPLSLQLKHNEDRFLIISGPNAGGKSVAMKTIGLLQYMLQCGLPVTADEHSEFGVFDQLFLDIGDSQSLENDLSTYSSRLTAMKYFSEHADKRTLVLMDEFGTGTEPQFGGAIAEALLNRLHKQNTFGVITTHYSNIKKFAEQKPAMINGAMRYDTEKLEPLYQLEIGKPGSSFAFEIARKIGLHPALIKYARGKVGISQVDYDRMLNDLESDKAKYEKLNRSLTSKEDELKELRADYESLKRMLESDRKQILKEAKLEARRIVDGANQKIEKAVRDIKESKANQKKTSAARKLVSGMKEKLEPEKELVAKVVAEAIAVGDKVKVQGQESIGEVLALKGKQAQVQFGQLTSFIDQKRLSKISNRQAKKESRKIVGGIDLASRRSNFSSELDLRGKRPEEALGLVDEMMDNAIMLGSSELRILHGKGYGVLREVVRNHLRQYPSVVDMHDEHIERGGSGITVVTLS